MCAPLLSKYELHPADRLIHHRGKGWWGVGGGGIQKGLREMSKRQREGGRREVGGIGSEMEKDERKESVLGEMSGRKR